MVMVVVMRLLAVDHHVLHLLLLASTVLPCGPDRGRRLVDLAPGERVVWILQV